MRILACRDGFYLSGKIKEVRDFLGHLARSNRTLREFIAELLN